MSLVKFVAWLVIGLVGNMIMLSLLSNIFVVSLINALVIGFHAAGAGDYG